MRKVEKIAEQNRSLTKIFNLDLSCNLATYTMEALLLKKNLCLFQVIG